MKRLLNNNYGFTYIAVLTVVIIMGIMLGMVGQSWRTINQRELEEELLFRGDQVANIVYQRLLCKNANLAPNTVNQFLWNVKTANGTILDDLIKNGIQETCVNGTQQTFKLRPSAAIDPFTKEPWEILTPATAVPLTPQPQPSTSGAPASTVVLSAATTATGSNDNQHFFGVRSNSQLKPLKEKFSAQDVYKLPDNSKHYSEWFFTWEFKHKMEATATQIINK